jgi:hypothetical protein
MGTNLPNFTEEEFLAQIENGRMLFGNYLHRCNRKQKDKINELKKLGKISLVVIFPKVNRKFT